MKQGICIACKRKMRLVNTRLAFCPSCYHKYRKSFMHNVIGLKQWRKKNPIKLRSKDRPQAMINIYKNEDRYCEYLIEGINPKKFVL